jgi:hypothetical protein
VLQIQIHEDLASLQKKLGKEYLTSDYGGELESVEELTSKFSWGISFDDKSFDFRNLGQDHRNRARLFQPFERTG